MSVPRRVVLAAGLLLYAALALTSMRVKSATFDEAAHLAAGYTYLTLGDFRMNPEHPPLIKVLSAAPLLFLDVAVRTEDPTWTRGFQMKFGRHFLYHWNDADRLLFWGRVPVVVLGCALAATVYLWARRRWGELGAALSLLLCVLSPDLLAHGQLVTTDVGMALFTLLTVVAFERLTEEATSARLLLAGLSLGAALVTKFSAVALIPILLSLGAVVVVSRESIPLRFGRNASLTSPVARLRLLRHRLRQAPRLPAARADRDGSQPRRSPSGQRDEPPGAEPGARPAADVQVARAAAHRQHRLLYPPLPFGLPMVA